MTNPPLFPMPRKAMTPRRRERILQAYNYACAVPGCANGGPYEIDHAHALGLGGSEDDDNLRPLCVAHHKEKSNGTPATSYGSDKHAIAKTKRLAKGPKEPTRKIQSRGFDKRYRKRMNGDVVER